MNVFAICLACDDRAGRSLRTGWLGVAAVIAAPILLLVAALVLLHFLAR
jgi:hypothetical protein